MSEINNGIKVDRSVTTTFTKRFNLPTLNSAVGSIGIDLIVNVTDGRIVDVRADGSVEASEKLLMAVAIRRTEEFNKFVDAISREMAPYALKRVFEDAENDGG